MDWADVYTCQEANSAYDTFFSLFTRIYNHHFPLITKTYHGREKTSQPWITRSIIVSCNHKNRLYRRYLRNPSEANGIFIEIIEIN